MPTPDDWDFNYAAKVISHIDGVLSYDTGTGTQPAVSEYVIGATSGAVGKVLATTGTVTSGTLTLTNVLGKFANGETLDLLSQVDFDGIGNGGFKVGDTIVDQVTGSMDVKFIEYNIDGVAGHGTAYGTAFTAFTNNSVIDISGGTAAVALADGVGVDNDTAFDALAVGTLAVPGTANTNNSVIIHYDAGTIVIPEDARVSEAGLGAEGYAQKVVGSTATGSVRLVDSDTTGGAWSDGVALRVEDVIYYDTLVAGKVFSEGDVLKGLSSGMEARVLAVIDDGDNSGKLILAGNTGAWTDAEDIQVLQPDDTYVTYADVEAATNDYLDAATINIPAGVRDEQRTDQGGIYGAGSLNIVRSGNAFYSYAQELFVQLGQLDDDPALEGNVKDQLYTILNDYVIPDLSFRFLEKGSFQDSAKNNIFTDFQSDGVVADIGAWGYFYDASNPTPQPDIYAEQDSAVLDSWWLEGHIDILVKIKTSTDPAYINPSVEALGQLIDGGKVTFHVRPYLRTYDTTELTKLGGLGAVFLANALDDNNNSAQYTAAYTAGAGAFVVGEEATTPSGKRIVIVSADTGATGDFTYVLKGDTNLVNTDVVTGSVSGVSKTSATPTNVVAGYGTNIRVMTTQRRFTGGTTTGEYVLGELVTQAVSGATGYFMEDDGGIIYLEEASGTFTGTNTLNGAGGAANTPTGMASYTTVPKDIGGGVGDKNYTAVVSADITDANPRPALEVYEWWKFLCRRESALAIEQPGSGSTSTEGRIFRRYDVTFAEVRGASPHGSKAGDLVTTAQGVFIEKGTLSSADLRNIKLRDNLGDAYDPPNLQALEMSNIFTGVNVAIFRSPGAGVKAALRTEFKVGAIGGGNNQAADNTILYAAQDRSVSPLPQDVPDTGVLWILDPNDTGDYLQFAYSAVNRTTNIFTLASGTIGDVTGAVDLTLDDNAHVAFITAAASGETINNTIQYVADIDLYGVARVKGKQPFSFTSTFISTGRSIGAVLNPDNVVNLP